MSRQVHRLHRVRGGGVEPPSPGSRPGSLPLADPRSSPCKSALWESNPPRRIGSPAPLPLGQGHIKAEGEGVEPSRLIARPLSGRLPSPIGLPFPKGCGGRNRTCVGAVNGRLPVPAQAPPQSNQSGRRELNPRSRAPATNAARRCSAECQAFLRPASKRPAGIEPALPPRQGGRLPLHHGRDLM